MILPLYWSHAVSCDGLRADGQACFADGGLLALAATLEYGFIHATLLIPSFITSHGKKYKPAASLCSVNMCRCGIAVGCFS